MFTGTIFLFILVPLFFVPTIIAVRKQHPHKIPIILINLIGGVFYGIGWIIALVWCFITPNSESGSSSTNIADEIEKLHALKENGILTTEEYEDKKAKLINL
ncbi:superinfection immunity protein [Colwellia sp. MT2012]|uniref:superinfection immunity protein n=1 Tax=Colwellia sp. MT2012 TaxID=1718921 RepID=UPI000708D6F9|nr:superinfection immunity protein [Colwellia sp. MT2012]